MKACIALCLTLVLLMSSSVSHAASRMAAPASAAPSMNNTLLAAPGPIVGVIPGPGGCVSPEYQSISYRQRNEWDNNQNELSGWSGGIVQGIVRTDWIFCRLPANTLFPLISFSDDGLELLDYMVLKLDDSCPVGSYEFRRYFDGEDDCGGDSGVRNCRGIENLTLNFCFFPGYYGDGETCDAKGHCRL
jgi:hypothetical protein